jgi:hypothetical protein
MTEHSHSYPDSGESQLPLQYEDGPDYCTVRDAQGRDFALTMWPDLMKAMERALTEDVAELSKPPAEPDIEAHISRLTQALKSISANTCCDSCREAALVARSALASYVGLAREPSSKLGARTGDVAQAPAYPDNANDPLADLVDRFSKRLLAKLRLAQDNGRSGWERDDWEKECQQGLLRHIEKGDPRDVAAYCAFMDYHGWVTVPASIPDVAQGHPDTKTLREVIAGIVDPTAKFQDIEGVSWSKFELERRELAYRKADSILGLLPPAQAAPERQPALAEMFSHSAVDEAMQDAWNDICSDTGCHPLDIEHGRGKHLTFSPNHWANQIAKRLFLNAVKVQLKADADASALPSTHQSTPPSAEPKPAERWEVGKNGWDASDEATREDI